MIVSPNVLRKRSAVACTASESRSSNPPPVIVVSPSAGATGSDFKLKWPTHESGQFKTSGPLCTTEKLCKLREGRESKCRRRDHPKSHLWPLIKAETRSTSAHSQDNQPNLSKTITGGSLLAPARASAFGVDFRREHSSLLPTMYILYWNAPWSTYSCWQPPETEVKSSINRTPKHQKGEGPAGFEKATNICSLKTLLCEMKVVWTRHLLRMEFSSFRRRQNDFRKPSTRRGHWHGATWITAGNGTGNSWKPSFLKTTAWKPKPHRVQLICKRKICLIKIFWFSFKLSVSASCKKTYERW